MMYIEPGDYRPRTPDEKEVWTVNDQGTVEKIETESAIADKEKPFQELWDKAISQASEDLQKRKEENPVPTKEEMEIGTFIERLEPQVRQAILTLHRKGYSTSSSGFYGFTEQSMEGFMGIDEETGKVLERFGARLVSSDSQNPESSWQYIIFEQDKADLEDLTRKWIAIADALPDKGETAYLNHSFAADEFRKEYGT